MERKLTCVECPKGCEITVEIDGDKIISVGGYSCQRGKKYAESEVICPRRVLTTTVKCADGGVVSVKTSNPVNKSEIFELMDKINKITVCPPVKIGQIIVKDIAEGSDLIATCNK